MLPSRGIVVIGRNEGQRLAVCLRSVCAESPIVYVDSGSSDGSPEFARDHCSAVVQLDMTRPFTAARARNAGFAKLIELAPEVEFVQFVDGDCEVHPQWLDSAIAAMRADGRMSVVCGRLRERHPDRSIYNRMCDLGWDYPIGVIDSCGGIAMYRAAAFAAGGGFNEALIAGEEFELCLRLRNAGGQIVRIESEMAWHDVDITSIRQWWRRTVRSGFGAAEGCCLYVGAASRSFRLRALRAFFWGGIVPLSLVGALTLAAVIPSLWFVPLSILAAWCLNCIRLALRERSRGQDWRTSALLGFFSMFGKVAELRGILEYWSRRLRGSTARVIEYRSAPASNS